VGLAKKEQTCSSCFRSEFGPLEARNSKVDICHNILVNEKGDTIESLKAEDDSNKLQATVLSRLKRIVAKLEEAVVVSKEASGPCVAQDNLRTIRTRNLLFLAKPCQENVLKSCPSILLLG
jgi:hypothetical protein